MISRDWQCLNPACRTIFHSFDKANPYCPACDCARVSWVPGGGHTVKVSAQADRDLRAISDQHGGMNLNSVSHSRTARAAPVLNKPGPPDNPEFGHRAYGGTGLSAPLSRQYDPHGDIYCATAPSNVSGKVNIGSLTRRPGGEAFNTATPRDAASSIPGPMANTTIEGRTIQRRIS